MQFHEIATGVLLKPFIPLLLLMFASLHAASEKVSTSSEVLLDNEYVKVVRLTYPPGSASGMHTHEWPHRVIYVLRGGTLKFISDGMPPQIRTVNAQTGEALFVPAQTHNVINAGLDEVILLETELKK